jgi:hypothetical protein
MFAQRCQRTVRGKSGLEIGGPSELFRRFVPVYKALHSLDNCVFSSDTIWEGHREDGAAFAFYPGKSGRNRIVDAVELNGIRDGEYDLILSCHSLEHIANPIKALKSWQRVAPKLLLVLPYCRETFDHRRPVTTLAHMIEDFERNVGEDDMSHLKEVVELSDLSRLTLPRDMTLETAKQLADPLRNPQNRCIHHHVFDEHNSIQLLTHCGYRVLAKQIAAASIFFLCG